MVLYSEHSWVWYGLCRGAIGGGEKDSSKVTFEMSSSGSSTSFGSDEELEEYFPSATPARKDSEAQNHQTLINTFLNQQRTSFAGMGKFIVKRLCKKSL